MNKRAITDREWRIEKACEQLNSQESKDLFRELANRLVDFGVFWDWHDKEAELYDGKTTIVMNDE